MHDSGVSSYRRNLNSPETLEFLVRTYSEPLVRYAYCLVGSAAVAEDAMEDAFAALLVKGGGFDSLEQVRSWLYKTTRNKAVDYLRRHSREVPLEDVENILSTSDTEENLLLRERNEKIYICLQRLPVQYREALQLYYLDGFAAERLCLIMRKSKKQVYNLLFRGKAVLKELLIQEGISDEDL